MKLYGMHLNPFRDYYRVPDQNWAASNQMRVHYKSNWDSTEIMIAINKSKCTELKINELYVRSEKVWKLKHCICLCKLILKMAFNVDILCFFFMSHLYKSTLKLKHYLLLIFSYLFNSYALSFYYSFIKMLLFWHQQWHLVSVSRIAV